MVEYHRSWSKEEVEILRELYGKVPNAEIAKVLTNRSGTSILKKANTLGLHYPRGGEIDYEYLKRLNKIVKGEDMELGEE